MTKCKLLLLHLGAWPPCKSTVSTGEGCQLPSCRNGGGASVPRWVAVGSLAVWGQVGAGPGLRIGCRGMGFWEGCAWGSSQSDVRI